MDYNELINTVSEIINNNNIHKEGLSLVYELEEENHKKMDEHLFYKSSNDGVKFKHRNVIEVVIGGILIKFIKKINNY